MKIAAIQHRIRDDAAADARALAEAAALAASRGADVIVLPDVPSLRAGSGDGDALLATVVRDVPAVCLTGRCDVASRGSAVTEPLTVAGDSAGLVSVIAGDSCVAVDVLRAVASDGPSLVVLMPRNETDLQAESMLEFAIALSDSLAGVIVIAECAGAEPLEVGHGASAIIVLGDVVAEALYDDDVLFADIPLPLPQPSPREPLPLVPPLLAQRLAHHNGVAGLEHGPDLS